MIELLLFSASFVTSYLGVAAYRRFSSKRGLLDVPNARSSHEIPTPRGGGLIIVIVSLISYCAVSFIATYNISWGYVVGALLIALVSWLDDLYSISFIARLLIHSVAACLVVADLGHWNDFYLLGTGITLRLGTVGIVITFFWIVWMVNAYNFMDGIDGIAGLQAIVASAGWLMFAFVFGYDSIYLFAGVLLFTNLGFLIHNWSPAKIFMGDVGSAFLGFTFAAVPLMALKEKPEGSFIIPVIGISFVWFFMFDTVLTFGLRLLTGKKVWMAHREHLYQRLILSGYSHRFVTVLYGIFAAIVGTSAIAFAVFRGSFEILLLSTITFLTATLLFVGFRKKILT